MPFPAPSTLPRTLPLLERMWTIEGWLSAHEADLLIAGAAHALTLGDGTGAVVEIGSYQGRSTSVLAGVVQALRPGGVVHAIDPHEGDLGIGPDGASLEPTPPTLEAFRRNMADAGLDDVVELHRQPSHEVAWSAPVAFLLVDGLHDYGSVVRDVAHFEPWLLPGAVVAFHDYADYFPGVKQRVDELVAGGGYAWLDRADSMAALRRLG